MLPREMLWACPGFVGCICSLPHEAETLLWCLSSRLWPSQKHRDIQSSENVAALGCVSPSAIAAGMMGGADGKWVQVISAVKSPVSSQVPVLVPRPILSTNPVQVPRETFSWRPSASASYFPSPRLLQVFLVLIPSLQEEQLPQHTLFRILHLQLKSQNFPLCSVLLHSPLGAGWCLNGENPPGQKATGLI